MVHSHFNAVAEALAAALCKRVRGEVRFDFPGRMSGSAGAAHGQQAPLGMVAPRDVNDVVETVAVCRGHDVPILTYGSGRIGLAEHRRHAAVIIDMSKCLHRVLAIDPGRQRALVEPGCALDVLRSKAEAYHLTFGPDPANHAHGTLDDVIGRDACGMHTVMAGRAVDNVDRLDILTYDGLRMTVGPTSEDDLETIIRGGGRRGQIYADLKVLRDNYADMIRARFPKIPRRVFGYALDQLLPENGFNVARALVGTGGTCVIVLHAELRLIPSPRERTLVLLGYPDICCAADHNAELMAFAPLGLEGIDDLLPRSMRAAQVPPQGWPILPEGRGWLLLEFGGETRKESEDKARQFLGDLRGKRGAPAMRLLSDPREKAWMWKAREAALAATTPVLRPWTARPGWADVCVHPHDVGPYLRDYRALLDKYGYRCSLYGHFDQGCIHCCVDAPAGEGGRRWWTFLDEATDLIARYNGSLSVQRGDGAARLGVLPKLYGDTMVQAFREFKAIWDPRNRMNPGMVVDQLAYAEPACVRQAI